MANCQTNRLLLRGHEAIANRLLCMITPQRGATRMIKSQWTAEALGQTINLKDAAAMPKKL